MAPNIHKLTYKLNAYRSFNNLSVIKILPSEVVVIQFLSGVIPLAEMAGLPHSGHGDLL